MSRTDHARITGTHRAGHPLREWRKEDCRLPVRPGITVSQALAEFQPAHEPIDLPGLKRLGQIDCDRMWLRWGRFEETSWPEALEALDDEPERMAEWEVILLGAPEDAVWTTASGDDRVGAYTDLYADVPDEPDEDDVEAADPSAWVHGDLDDFFQSVGDGFVFEGPSVTKPEPLHAGHYVRVYELAREVGIESRDLIRHLRASGEYVRCAQSFVALPVAKRMNAIADALIQTYGARKDGKRDPIAQMRVLLAEERLHALAKTRRVVRPGAPRPGNNPFSLAYARSN